MLVVCVAYRGGALLLLVALIPSDAAVMLTGRGAALAQPSDGAKWHSLRPSSGQRVVRAAAPAVAAPAWRGGPCRKRPPD